MNLKVMIGRGGKPVVTKEKKFFFEPHFRGSYEKNKTHMPHDNRQINTTNQLKPRWSPSG